jgi:hypothetical protein
MSTNRSVGRSTSTQEKVRSASKFKKERSPNLCAFAFADGRQCRTPRCSGHLHYCYFHAQKKLNPSPPNKSAKTSPASFPQNC